MNGKNGSNGGGELAALFDLERLLPKVEAPKGAKAIYVKIMPGTAEYNMMLAVKKVIKAPDTKIFRLLIKAGYLVFARSEERRLRNDNSQI